VPQRLDHPCCSLRAGQDHDRPLGLVRVEGRHGRVEVLLGLVRGRELAGQRLETGRHQPAFLVNLEAVQRPEGGQEPFLHRGVQGQLVRGVEHSQRVAGLDGAEVRQVERGQEVAVGQPVLEQPDHHGRALRAPRVLDEAHDGFEVGAEPDEVRRDLGVVGRRRAERSESGPLAQAE
jgi:hypothetical protein